MESLLLALLLAAYSSQPVDSDAALFAANPGSDMVCKDCTSSTSRDSVCSLESTLNYQACRCDTDCDVYGDCCPSRHRSCSSSSRTINAPPFHCLPISIGGRDDQGKLPAVGEHYWMVSACLENWLEENRNELEIEVNCVNSSNSLPPVSDPISGLVYRNEYCALCNGVRDVVVWDYGFKCSPELGNLLNESSYTLIADDFNRYCTLRDYVEPSLPISVPTARPCYPQINSCYDRDRLETVTMTPWNSSYYNQLKALCTEGHFQSQVIHSGERDSIPYRNEYCALCNGVDPLSIECFQGPSNNLEISGLLPSMGNIHSTPFSIILDVYGSGRVVATSFFRTASIDVSCSAATEVYDPVVEGCRPTLIQDCSNGEHALVRTTLDSSGNCTQCMEELIALMDSTTFEFTEPNTLLYDEQLYVVEYNTSDGFPVICVNFSTNGTQITNIHFVAYTYPREYMILTYIGCPLSVLGCILILLTYTLFKELQTLPSKILMHLAIAILLSNLLILVGGPIIEKFEEAKVLCTPAAILTHYIFLTQFSWMSLMSTEIARNLYRAFKMKTRESKAYKLRILVIYILVGWCTPLLIVMLTVIVNFTTTNLVLYGEMEGGKRGPCWINQPESVYVSLVAPMAISLIYNTVVFIVVTTFLFVSSRSNSKLKEKKNLPYLRLNFAVFSISGITWMFGFLALLPRLQWAWIPYIILNSTQGFIIFVAFLCTKRVALLYISLLFRRKDKGSSSEISTKDTVSSAKGSKQLDEHLA